jgi:beta-galactosidase
MAAGKKVTVVTTIISPEGNVVGQRAAAYEAIPAGTLIDSGVVDIAKPALWSVETPVLYKAIVKAEVDGKVVDRYESVFGIRSIEFSSTNGFLLNGKRVVLKGGCIHHDNGPLGTAAINRAEERKVELMKKAGYNAIRCSHNPPSTAFLQACDKLGMLVLDEAFDMWRLPKNPQDYHLNFDTSWQKDIDAMVLRDRNHPSVIIWSIGNEIFEAPDAEGYSIGAQLAGEVHRLDATRPVTTAIAYMPGYTKKPWPDFQPQLTNVDVDGYNYFLESGSHFFVRDSATAQRFDSEHALHPAKTFIVTEYSPQSALQNYERPFTSPWLLGAFKWTAMDYIGEANIGSPRLFPQSKKLPDGMVRMAAFYLAQWPVYNAYCGDLDLVGNKKAASYYQDVVWGKSPAEILVNKPVPEGMKEEAAPWGFPDEIRSWSWPGREGKKMQVHVYARGTKVVLELNGKMIAEQPIPPGSITAAFEVEYQPGTLLARVYNGAKETGTCTLKTTGKPAAIRLTADRSSIQPDAGDLSFVRVEIVDADGNVVPYADDMEVSYAITGAGTIAGVGNGRMDDASSFQQNHKKVFHGEGLVITRPTASGNITIKATAAGLLPAKAVITAK